MEEEVYNAGAFIANGKVVDIYRKMNLPNYGVFDEKRYFCEGKKGMVVEYGGKKIGLGICEDLWVDNGPYLEEAHRGAHIILNINASPYHRGKIKLRDELLTRRARAANAHVVYINMVGGQDELVFDGGSMVYGPDGNLAASARQFEEEIVYFEMGKEAPLAPRPEDLAEVYQALVLCTRDYVQKNGFSKAVIGLSGGIDSALTLAIAADALGSSRVKAVFMPSQFSAVQSAIDAQKVAANLDVPYSVIRIVPIYNAYLEMLKEKFEGKAPDITEENLQARIRGNILMAISNKFGSLVLTTGNKSEMSTGYCTLYGDMAGGFAVLKDVPKTLVYQLVGWRNREKEVVPQSIIDRPPTAELKPDQKDQDTLPPYDILDPIMEAYVEENLSKEKIVARGFDSDTVEKVIKLIDHSEYKRRQSPPGPAFPPARSAKTGASRSPTNTAAEIPLVIGADLF